MLQILLRASNSVIAVFVGIAVSLALDENSRLGKAVTILVATGIVVLLEWLQVWLPKKSVRIRRMLDSRAVFEGVWLQKVVAAYDAKGFNEDHPNRFSVVTIQYNKQRDNY